jgi:Lon protease-like protein
MPQTGILHIETHALERFVVRSTRAEPNGLLVGAVEDVSAESAIAVPDDLELAVEILRHIIDEYGDAHFPGPLELDNAVWVGYRLSEVLPLTLSIKQNLLEMNDSVMRLRILTDFLKKQIN